MNNDIAIELRYHLNFLISELKKENINENVQDRSLKQFVNEILKLRIPFNNETHEVMCEEEYRNNDIDPLNSNGLIFEFFRLLEHPIEIAPAWEREIINIKKIL